MEDVVWQLPEYEEREFTTDWFWSLGIGAVALGALAVYFNNYILAILIIVAAFAMAMFTMKKPRLMKYRLSDNGIAANETLYPFNTLQSFCIERYAKRPKIMLTSKKFFMPHIVIPIEGHDPEDIRERLLKKLPEVEHEQPFVHTLLEHFGF